MRKLSKYRYWIIIVALSLLFSFLFSLAREHRILTHLIFGGLNPIQYFGYGSNAFLLSLPMFLVGFIILYYLIRAFIKGGYVRKAIIGVIVVAIVLNPIYSHPVAIVNQVIPPVEPDLGSNSGRYVIFTFDTEEDWDPYIHCYYDSYIYITSGAFSKLVDGLSERNASATFYVTPNLARDMPEVLRCLESEGQTIGVHLHPHTLVNINYPYASPYTQTKGDCIANYSYPEKLDLMRRAKDEAEGAVGHEVLLYRSGKLSCDYEVEKIAEDLGYEAISNHKGIYFIEPIGIWNIGEGTWDILDSDKFHNLDDYKTLFKSRAEHEHIITFSGHPMRLYNLSQNQVDEEQIELFLQFVDWLRKDEGVEIINQYQLVRLVQSQ